jgi:hypothetical protein
LTVSNTHLTTLENQGSLAEKFNRCKVYDFYFFWHYQKVSFSSWY